MRFVFWIFTTVFFISCDRKTDVKADAIARVYDDYLYASDIKNIFPKSVKVEDSILIADKYIKSWITETLILRKAEDNLTMEQKDVQRQLDDYRNSLITFAYEREIVKQKLDTVVSEIEIENYYMKNKNNFELKDNIIKVLYVKVSNNAPNIPKLKNWCLSEGIKDKEALEDYCHQYAENFYLDDNSWLLFSDMLKEIPIQPTYNKELFLKNNRFIELSDSTSTYFVNIKDFQIKNSISPLTFEKENIKNIILNKRKIELVSKIREDALSEAQINKEVEVFK